MLVRNVFCGRIPAVPLSLTNGSSAHTAVIRDSAAQAERKTMLVLFELFIKTALISKSLFVA